MKKIQRYLKAQLYVGTMNVMRRKFNGIKIFIDGLLQITMNAANRRIEFYDQRRVAIGVVGIISFPLYYCIWKYAVPQPYENLTLRLIGSIIFVPLIISHKWPEALEKYLALGWHLVILYSLPFFFTFMFLKNEGSTVWLVSSIVAFFIMLSMLESLILFLQCIFGVLIGIFAYVATTENPHLPSDAAIYVPVFVFR